MRKPRMSGATSGAFESYARDPDEVKSTDRGFGRVMAVFLALVAGFQYWHARPLVACALLVAALAFALFAQFRPAVLRPLNLLWFKLGLVLHKVVNPIVMAVIFYGAVVPTGLLMRALGKRPLALRPDPAAASYWIARDPPGPAPESMKRQF